MFKHILIPTDGSDEAMHAVKEGITLAAHLGATVTGIYVIPEYRIFTVRADMLEDTPEEYDHHCMTRVRKNLGRIQELAEKSKVDCCTMYWVGDCPHQFIAKIARDRRCDLIVMASHYFAHKKGMLEGSETQKVLSEAQIPVLIFRP
jgi:nucleotide-binding universal stress UspA family protein